MSDLFLRPLFTWRAVVASKHGPKNPTTRHVLLTLGLYMSEKGDSCFPATRTLAVATALSHRAIITHLKLASSEGWIGRKERPMKDGKGWRRMEYFATIPFGAEVAYRGEAQSPAYRGEPGAPASGDEPGSVGGERGDTLLVNDVHLNTSVNSPREKAERAARATRLKGDWVLPKAWGDWALTEQSTWTAEHVRKVADNFRDHWIAAPKGTKLDWLATWRKWVRGEPAMKGTTLNGHGQPWYLKASGIEAKAKELGIKVPEGKDGWQAFRDEVYQRAGVTDEMLKAARQDAPR